ADEIGRKGGENNHRDTAQWHENRTKHWTQQALNCQTKSHDIVKETEYKTRFYDFSARSRKSQKRRDFGKRLRIQNGITGRREVTDTVGDSHAYLTFLQCAGVIESVSQHQRIAMLVIELFQIVKLINRTLIEIEVKFT